MAFFAIQLPKDLQHSIADALEPWHRRLPNVRWTHPDDYHLTLRFVAGLAPANLQLLMQPLSFESFELDLDGLQTFPGVLWVGLKSVPASLLQLQEKLEKQVQALGFPPDARAFNPHITLGRFEPSEAARIEIMRGEVEDTPLG